LFLRYLSKGADRKVGPLLFVLAIVWCAAAACAGGRNGAALSSPQIELVVAEGHPESAMFVVQGLSEADLAVLRGRQWSSDEWTALFHVSVAAPGDQDSPNLVPPMAGSYAIEGNDLHFKPAFGLDLGRRYRAALNLAQLPSSSGLGAKELVKYVELPKPPQSSSTVVDHVFPTAEVVPENQLRLYIHFSAPMGRKGGLDYVRLLDERGETVKDPFLPLDAEFWNADRTRFTVFFDPGRVKRGVLPNVQMGRSLTEGHSYTLVVSRDWLDAQGMPLASEFRRTFKVGAPDEKPLDQHAWRIDSPRAGARHPLTITFPEPLDQGLLMRALGVTTAAGGQLPGEIQIESQETRWMFTPRDPWKAGDYRIKVLTILEDLSGNRIGRAFEVDNFERADRQPEPDEISIPFTVT